MSGGGKLETVDHLETLGRVDETSVAPKVVHGQKSSGTYDVCVTVFP